MKSIEKGRAKSEKVLIMVGTRKGLFLFHSKDRRHWKMTGPFLKGKDINHAMYDRRTGRLFATSNDAWFGSEIVWSENLGKTWASAKKNPAFSAASGLKLDRIWHLEPGHSSEPDVIYAGVAPASLFRSEDRGVTWKEISSLSQHPTRSRWHPGAGGLCLHSIVVDPSNAKRLFVGISAVGVFRSEDEGKTWETANRGTRAEFMPNKYPEFGQCVHKLLMSSDGNLFQQNHCGMYRSENGGRKWVEITRGLPSDFGFPLGIHPHKPSTIFVIPLQGAEFRCPPKGELKVYRSRNGGKTWQGSSRGLPGKQAFCSVFREGMAVDDLAKPGVYFGTSSGSVFFSLDEGSSWKAVAENLPTIVSVEVART
jgi:hypothetical protein